MYQDYRPSNPLTTESMSTPSKVMQTWHTLLNAPDIPDALEMSTLTGNTLLCITPTPECEPTLTWKSFCPRFRATAYEHFAESVSRMHWKKLVAGYLSDLSSATPAPKRRASEISTEQGFKNSARCHQQCGWVQGRVQGFDRVPKLKYDNLGQGVTLRLQEMV